MNTDTPYRNHRSWLALLLLVVTLTFAAACGGDEGGGEPDAGDNGECSVGDEGCACETDGSCDLSDDGFQLACQSGLCVDTCSAGQRGCGCDEGACDGELACDSSSGVDLCVTAGCEGAVGTDGCECAADRSCGDGLSCVLSTCADAGDCEIGAEGCPCTQAGACDGGLTCDADTDLCAAIGCTPGSIGCECDAGTCTGAGAVCDAGICELAGCPAGQEGCACLDGRCGVNGRGESLVCSDDVCTAGSCDPGALGCACLGGTECTDDGSACVDGFCQLESCATGELYCGCHSGICSSDLTCREGVICVDGAGYIGGQCRYDGSCERGGACSGGVCVPCFLGTNGCGCNDAGGCVSGLSCDYTDSCVPEDEVIARIPENPVCYTPCTEGITTADGEYRACPADGLMAGCIGDLSCQNGTCLLTGETAAGCETDSNCPEHQACMGGTCYSNCLGDSDCGGGAECYLHVCRMPCMSENAGDCDFGSTCRLLDSVGGFCMPIAAPEAGGASGVEEGNFSVDTAVVALSNTHTTTELVITNNSPELTRFVVRKLDHLMYFEDGTSESLIDHYDDVDLSGAAVECAGGASCPLWWLEIGEQGGAVTPVTDFDLFLDAGESARVIIRNAAGSNAVRWSGTIQIVSPSLGTSLVTLNYSERPEGQWRGTVYYYADWGTEGIDEWAADLSTRDNATLQLEVENAFVQRWTAFRSGRIPWDSFQAAMIATENGSWEWVSDDAECRALGGGATSNACYLYDGSMSGFAEYASNLQDTPIPSGVIELPFAMNLHMPEPINDPARFDGRIDSASTLHYAGDPAVTLRLHSAPDQCDRVEFGTCINYIESFSAEVPIGGRYRTTDDDTNCSERADGDYQLFQIPWLIPGFLSDTVFDSDSGRVYRYECRDGVLPFDPGLFDDPEMAIAANLSLSQSNPIPDGRTRRRTLRLVDGALINQSQMVILFEESMASFLGAIDTEGISAYGYIVLERQAVDLPEDDETGVLGVPDVYEGSHLVDQRTDPDDVLDVSCSADMIDELIDAGVIDFGDALDADNADEAISVLIDGMLPTASQVLSSASNEQPHYFCEDTGLIDGGPDNATAHGIEMSRNNNSCDTVLEILDQEFSLINNGLCEDGGPLSVSSQCPLNTDYNDCGVRYTADGDDRVACPLGSRVIFFTVDSAIYDQEDIANLACQQTGTCLATLTNWQQSSDPIIQMEPTTRCALLDPDIPTSRPAYCDSNRRDLRDGKEFFSASENAAVLPSMRAELERAFRYKIRFRNREGTSLGFAPEICIPNSDQVPYCYDPAQIEGLVERVDCLMAIWNDHYIDLEDADTLDADIALNALDDFLAFNFSAERECVCTEWDDQDRCIAQDPNRCVSNDGFERLYSELLIMMGDESFTQSFASRFDLAASRTHSFEGTLFEADGINLSGVPGAEMYNLYQAVQYYQEALDRFYSLSPLVWLSVQEDVLGRQFPDDTHRISFVTPETVTTYMERLVRASTQKARAWSEIAERYQGFDQPELARRVIERAYTATYLESAALSRIMQRIRDSFLPEDRPQIDAVLEQGQLRYHMAMLDMRNVYSTITDSTTIFGFDPQFIPFPTLRYATDNAFETMRLRANERISLARSREEAALSSNRSYETDAAQFQAELTRIRNTYENELGDVCGTFVADDGRVYPAIRRYAPLSEGASRVGDPCGLVGNGQITDGMAQLNLLSVDVQRVLQNYQNTFERIDIERQRVADQCGIIDGLAAYVLCSQVGDKCGDVPADAPSAGLVSDGTSEFCLDFVSATDSVDLPGDADALVQAVELACGADAEPASVLSLETAMSASRGIQTVGRELMGALSTYAQLGNCTVGTSNSCPTALAAAGVFTIGAGLNFAVQVGAEGVNAYLQNQISRLQSYTGYFQTVTQCDQLQVDSNARIQEMMLELAVLDLEMVRLQYQVQLALADIERLHNRALRLQLEQEEVEQMTINVEAARNDPNIRIYRNDSIINADIAFESARRSAYQATRVYEYYTSQEFAEREQLFLIRMVASGDYNLENYMIALEDAYYGFEDEFGAPDNRVAFISLRDDILNVPYVDEEGHSYTNDERSGLMRQRLSDPSLLDENGYLTIPFSVDVDELSPLTRNHKINFIEADIQGSDLGDSLGRIYLRASGTGVVHNVRDERQFFRFPERTAVVDTFFNGVRFFEDHSIYQTFRLRDRPLANTTYEFVINQRDELVNQDIALSNITDIRVYINYTDFTVF